MTEQAEIDISLFMFAKIKMDKLNKTEDDADACYKNSWSGKTV